MTRLLPLTVFSIISIAVFSGLSASFTVTVFMLLSMLVIGKNFRLNLFDYKLELVFLAYLFLSAYLGINPQYSFFEIIKIFTLLFFTAVILANIAKLDTFQDSCFKSLTASVVIAVVIIHFEINTQGLVITTFKEIFQNYKSPLFYLYFLDRGSSLVSVITWVIIAGLLKNNRIFAAILLYLLVLLTISITDSLASFVALILSAIVFLVARFIHYLRNPVIVGIFFVISAISMITFAFSMNARELSDNTKSLPFSAKHRLMIWEFVADKSSENLVTGVGIGNSRFVKILPEEQLLYEGIEMSPLPLHPHNVVMQVMLETGIVGMIIFLMIAMKYLTIMGKNYYMKDSSQISVVAARYACFTTFYIISMISFNFWHGWWLSTAAFTAIAMSWFTRLE